MTEKDRPTKLYLTLRFTHIPKGHSLVTLALSHQKLVLLIIIGQLHKTTN